MAPEVAWGAAAARPGLAVRLPAMVRLLRPLNATMTALGVAVGAYVQAGPAVAGMGPELALAALAGFASAGAGNALNDYVDREVDKQAHPERPIPRGHATPRDALRLQATMFALAAVAAALLGPLPFALVVVAMGLMVAYEVALKAQGLPGNVAIAALTGAPFLLGALAAGGVGALAVLLALLAAVANLGREIVKDVEDMAADVGRRTLPMRIGARQATRLAQGALLGGVALSPLPALVGAPMGPAYLPLVALADAGFLASAWRATARPREAQRLAKAAMLAALAAFALGRLTA